MNLTAFKMKYVIAEIYFILGKAQRVIDETIGHEFVVIEPISWVTW